MLLAIPQEYTQLDSHNGSHFNPAMMVRSLSVEMPFMSRIKRRLSHSNIKVKSKLKIAIRHRVLGIHTPSSLFRTTQCELDSIEYLNPRVNRVI